MQTDRCTNGVRYQNHVRQKARVMRSAGSTHREVGRELGISVSTAYLWTRGITLTPEQKYAIQMRQYHAIFTPETRRRLGQLAKVRLAPFQYKRKYSRRYLVNEIRAFCLKYGRIPLKREFGSRRVFRQYFGTWNEAIQAAGFIANPVRFSKKFVARDGHRCDSFAEKIIDDWLSAQRITHERNSPYGTTRMTADFLIAPNTVLEFFGLAGVQENYDRLIETKRKLCRALNLRLVEVYPGDIIPQNRLSELLAAL